MSIDPKEAKLLGDILALVVSDQPGQSRAALDKLCKRARADRITGGAIKAVFDRIRTEIDRPRPGLFSDVEDTGRLTDLVRRLQKEDEATRTLLEMEQATSNELRSKYQDLRRLVAILAPIVALSCALGGYLAADLRRPAAPSSGVRVDPASGFLPDTAQPDVPLPPGVQRMPADIAVLPADIRQQIADHLVNCGALPKGGSNNGHPLHIQAEISSEGVIRIVRISPTDGQILNDPAFQAIAGQIGHKLVTPDCAALPIPAYLKGRVKTVSLSVQP